MVLEHLNIQCNKQTNRKINKSGQRPYALYKNKIKMYRRPKCKIQNYKTPRI